MKELLYIAGQFILIGSGFLYLMKGETDKAIYINTLVIALNSIGTHQLVDYIDDKVREILHVLLYKS